MPEAQGASGALAEIKRRIRAQGPMTFAEFMGLALYSPQGGYYTSDIDRWGLEGDYVTNIDISPLFARSMAKQIAEMHALLGSPDAFTLIEAGAGRGLLSKGVYDELKDLSPALQKTIRIKLVEKNHHIKEKIKGALPENFSWHEDMSEIPAGITGCVISNELIDALPVHRVTFKDNDLHEICTGLDGENLVDVTTELSNDALRQYFIEPGVTLAENQIAEVNLQALDWIAATADIINKGFIITIDYGVPARELYAPERGSTIHCHYQHTLSKNPYERVGDQDITAHVDFSALVRAGCAAGAKLTGFTTQKNFLLGLGIMDEAIEPANIDLANYENIKRNQMIKELILPGGMGDVFKVLIQHKGVEKPFLKGLSFRDMSRFL